jgi:hypothetical protein
MATKEKNTFYWILGRTRSWEKFGKRHQWFKKYEARNYILAWMTEQPPTSMTSSGLSRKGKFRLVIDRCHPPLVPDGRELKKFICTSSQILLFETNSCLRPLLNEMILATCDGQARWYPYLKCLQELLESCCNKYYRPSFHRRNWSHLTYWPT